MTALVESAPAKINLTLAVLGRADDGYHLLDSLVVFADIADRLTFVPGEELSLQVHGATATAAGPVDENLVIKAARALSEAVPGLKLGAFTLEKRLPVAAGVGGGSSDAAAALRLLARANGLAASDPRLHPVARSVGADVPVCLDPKPRRMRGIGDVLSDPLVLPPLHAVLINPRVAVPTADVFKHLGLVRGGLLAEPPPMLPPLPHESALIEHLAAVRNDLEPPAIALQPVIADVLSVLRAAPDCALARMSGSGATCFGLFTTADAATAAAGHIVSAQPKWWVEPTVLR